MDRVERDLIRELETLGLDAESARAIALLPLVEVAWADGTTQPAERRAIVELAKKYGYLEGKGADVLKRWLTEKPDPSFFERGRKLFVRLAVRKTGVGATVPESSIETVIKMCEEVADSAGGLFDLLFTTSKAEKVAIARIATALQADADKVTFDPKAAKIAHTIAMDWKQMMAQFEEE